MPSAAAEGMALLYQGSANTWECDEMGHMNVRFYVRRAMEGLGCLAARIGMTGAFRPHARSTLTPLQHHIRFLKEVRAGQPLTMVGGVLTASEKGADLYMEVRHVDGAPAAAIRTLAAHASTEHLVPFPWPARMHAALETLRCTLPPHGAPRSVVLEPPMRDASFARAEALGLPQIGVGMVAPNECDAFGRMNAEMFIGRVSDAVPNLLAGWRTQVGQATAPDGAARPVGAAVLEYRLTYRRWPSAGDGLLVRSGVMDVGEKTHRLAHWLLDPETGEAWATAEAVAVVFDLEARKAIALPAAQRKALAAMIVPDLTG